MPVEYVLESKNETNNTRVQAEDEAGSTDLGLLNCAEDPTKDVYDPTLVKTEPKIEADREKEAAQDILTDAKTCLRKYQEHVITCKQLETKAESHKYAANWVPDVKKHIVSLKRLVGMLEKIAAGQDTDKDGGKMLGDEKTKRQEDDKTQIFGSGR